MESVYAVVQCVHTAHPWNKEFGCRLIAQDDSCIVRMSVDEFVQHGAEYADISCLMAMMIFTEEEFERFDSVSTVIPDYAEAEGVSRPVEFSPDVEDALAE